MHANYNYNISPVSVKDGLHTLGIGSSCRATATNILKDHFALTRLLKNQVLPDRLIQPQWRLVELEVLNEAGVKL